MRSTLVASVSIILACLFCACSSDGKGQDSGTIEDTGAPPLDGGSDAGVDASADGGTGDAGMIDIGPTECHSESTSDLQGASIQVPGNSCVWTLAQAQAGIDITYKLVVENDIQDVYPTPQDAGRCNKPGASGLILFEILQGNGQRYCVCDEGLCQGPGDQPLTVLKGTYPADFSWNGENWGGPSDTNQPKGDPFPPGAYKLSVNAQGSVGANKTPFNVIGTFLVYLVP